MVFYDKEVKNVKVFISWSGDKSHKIATIFRDWLPSVIQSIVPYVSSEDIDKGARWSTDIAKELADSSFGILCVTKDNLNAPWLCFEAGALSKTIEKSFVSPFLFNVKRSEIDGPILQFQSTIFDKEDIKKLVNTLNKACGEAGISPERLDKAFEVWYPTLEQELNSVISDDNIVDDTPVEETSLSADILEEILDLSRENQKLLRNPDTNITDALGELSSKINHSLAVYERGFEARRMSKKYKINFLDEFTHMARTFPSKTYGFLIILTFFKEDFPWIYDMGKELVDIIKSPKSIEEKKEAVYSFRELLDFTLGHPVIRDVYGRGKESMVLFKELPYMLMDYIDGMETEN